ncbi:radical SAM protein [Nocardia nova]|uniref:radical SAM protein n=1 Tax=Nocardia nova TaxID=37330 RepID=UPI001CA473AA|nr:radical SAM protein [Nocardia nova]
MTPALHLLPERLNYRHDLGLLFDRVSGAFHRLRNTVARNMVEQIFSGADRQTVIDRVSARYHVESGRVARDLDKLVAELLSHPVSEPRRHGGSLLEIDKRFDTALDFPLRLEIELTAVCNWNCGFCYNVWKIDPTMPDSDIRRAVRNLPDKHIPTELAKSILGECADRGCFVIRYSGGETLLHPDAMEIVEYGGSLGLYQVIFTKATSSPPTALPVWPRRMFAACWCLSTATASSTTG